MKVVVFLLVFVCCFHQIRSLQRSIVVLKAYKNDSVSDHRCIYLSKTSRLDPFLQTVSNKFAYIFKVIQTVVKLVVALFTVYNEVIKSLFTMIF
ncbi:unnamed protein product [Trichobilharzia szidati]|nr:unnamed protein product [Trichobilharzia szidati]